MLCLRKRNRDEHLAVFCSFQYRQNNRIIHCPNFNNFGRGLLSSCMMLGNYTLGCKANLLGSRSLMLPSVWLRGKISFMTFWESLPMQTPCLGTPWGSRLTYSTWNIWETENSAMLVSSGVFSSLLLLRHKNGFLCCSPIDLGQCLFSKLKKQSKKGPSNLYADV